MQNTSRELDAQDTLRELNADLADLRMLHASRAWAQMKDSILRRDRTLSSQIRHEREPHEVSRMQGRLAEMDHFVKAVAAREEFLVTEIRRLGGEA